MKVMLLILLLPFISPAEWQNDFAKAKNEAAVSNKLILLNFSGSDWCIPCIKMKKDFFNSDVFIKYADSNLILVNADFPRLKKNRLSAEQTSKNELLADQYNKEGAFPYTVLLNSQGIVLKEWSGHPEGSVEDFVNDIKKIQSAGN